MFFCLSILFWCSIPKPLFKDPYSTILTDNQANLLSAKIASDGQWRFPKRDSINPKFINCLLAFEDQYFYMHDGINPFSISRALHQNSKRGKIVSGGSTITMQLMRLVRKNKARNYKEKLLEIVMALRTELTYSKNDILIEYCSHAPFGSNVVGVDAAAWRYFGRTSDELSWAECATLAVLPNAPSLIYPGKNQLKLLKKRNNLLLKLYQLQTIDDETYQLAIQEPLPQKPFPLPDLARHLLNRSVHEYGNGKSYITTLDGELQQRTSEIINRHVSNLKSNDIHNACALVLDVKNNTTLAYIGNSNKLNKEDHGNDVDVITSPRSTGSLLKPFLYAFMLHEGELLPNTLVPDIPTQIAGYTPQNYNLTFDGAVPAKKALARSLNIPAVKLLQQYGIEKFTERLKQLGLTTVNRSADNYGLSLILGGAEGKLWDLCNSYASMARTLNNYTNEASYSSLDWVKASYLQQNKKEKPTKKENTTLLSAASIWLTFDAMLEVSRPDIDASWQRLSSSQKVAWKTGTSFGFRDGWAIGVTTDYVVGVWVGNADGEGRPGLTGIATAAPILFEIFGVLPKSTWFKQPLKDTKAIKTCKNSGYRASANCPTTKTEWVPKTSERSIACPYHKLIHLDASETYRVTENCVSPMDMKTVSWFVLPPVQEYYYKIKNPTYITLPPYKEGCMGSYSGKTMDMIYPKNNTILYIPVDLNGEQSKTIFELAHRLPQTTVHWHVDDRYIGATKDIHQMALNPNKGKHLLTLTDELGESLVVAFEVVSEKK